MEIRNETPLAVATLPCERNGGEAALTVIVKGTFAIRAGEPAALAEEQLPVAFADELFDQKGGSVKFESDLAPFKPRADIALVGQAHVPRGQRARALEVSLRVGTTKKMLRVFGDRRWRCSGRLLPARMTAAESFTTMPLVYERAFGGIDRVTGGYSAHNLVGTGLVAKKRRQSLNGMPLPNIEDPQHLIRSWQDRPPPAGFGFCAKGWQPRLGYLGTYDERWQADRAPLPPADFREDFYNAAHPDLQVAGYLRGDEEVELVFLSPDERLTFRLPGVQPVCRVTKDDTLIEPEPGPATTEDVVMHLDTLCLVPDEGKLYQVWRGSCPVRDLTMAEVRELAVAAGRVGD